MNHRLHRRSGLTLIDVLAAAALLSLAAILLLPLWSRLQGDVTAGKRAVEEHWRYLAQPIEQINAAGPISQLSSETTTARMVTPDTSSGPWHATPPEWQCSPTELGLLRLTAANRRPAPQAKDEP